ncbi:MAG: hypothetical protein KGM91_22765, partial [Burkholderiales bacterium]|nr:hypothetical protein [Burkholderiales bacterium]
MTRHPGVYDRRPASTFWWFYQTVPADLAHRFPRPWAERQSLKTRDLREANARAKLKAAEWERTFAAMRLEENPQELTLSPALVASVAAEVRRWVLEADDNMRGFPEGPGGLLAREDRRRGLEAMRRADAEPLAGLLGPLPIPSSLSLGGAAAIAASPVPDPLEGLTDSQAGAIARFNAEGAAAASIDMARRNLKEAHAFAVEVSRSLGWRADWTTPQGRAGLMEVLKAYRTARADLVRRDAGDVVDTPQQAQPRQGPAQAPGAAEEGQGKGKRIADALEAWEGLAIRKPKTLSVFRRHVGQFNQMAGDPLLSAIGKPEASKFAADLQRWAVEQRKTKETADNVLASIKALAGVAVREGWMAANPFAGLAVTKGGKETDPREPWTPEELPVLFASPIFTAYRVPQPDNAVNRKAGLDAAYWVPLLCLFSGARPAEACQLWTDDVSEVQDREGSPLLVVEFRDNPERG